MLVIWDCEMYSNIIWGYWGENILGELAKDLQDRKSNVICLDPTKDDIPDTKGIPINLLISNHFTRTSNDLNDLYPEFGIKHDYYDLVRNIKPANSFFFIHDHSELLVLDEPSTLFDFTAVISPWPGIHKNIMNKNLFCCDMAFKNVRDFEQHTVNRKSVWFVSNIKYNVSKYGIKGFSDSILKIIEGCEISIKLPEYGVTTSLIEKNLVENGVDVLPSSLSSARLAVEAEIIISSSFSGIITLAQYYKKDCIIVKNTHPMDFHQQQDLYNTYAPLLGKAIIIENNTDMKAALGVSIKNKTHSHRCGVFRDDFIDEYHQELFNAQHPEKYDK